MKKANKYTVQQDREIINSILLHIISTDRRECKFANAVQCLTEGRISEDQFHDWITHFDIESIRRK